MKKLFTGIRNFLQFLKIIMMLNIFMLFLHWIEHLSGTKISFISFATPFLDSFIETGALVSKKSIEILGAVFEYKYLWAFVFMLVIVFLIILAQKLSYKIEDIIDDILRAQKSRIEDEFNKKLDKAQSKEQSAIKNYQVYIETSIKNNILSLGQSINIDEQNTILNKHLITQFNISPTKFGDGFLYSFSDFNYVDSVLQVLFKVLKSEAPVDYTICVQICDSKTNYEESLRTLIGLSFKNKISMLADTAFRYSYNKTHSYQTSQLGVFQKGEDSIVALEFVEN